MTALLEVRNLTRAFGALQGGRRRELLGRARASCSA